MKTKFLNNQIKNCLLVYKKFILFFVAVFLMLSCSNNDDAPFTPVNIEFDVIGTGFLLGAGTEEILAGNYVINNQNDWNLLLNKMNSFYTNTTSDFITTNINFQTHIIIAVFDEVRMSNGFLINVANITENQDNFTVDVVQTNPGSIQSMITQPYQIVRIPITTKPILFE